MKHLVTLPRTERLLKERILIERILRLRELGDHSQGIRRGTRVCIDRCIDRAGHRLAYSVLRCAATAREGCARKGILAI